MYTEGILESSAVILKDGVPIGISEILEKLNRLDEAEEVIRFYTKNGQLRKVKDGIIEYDVDGGPLYNYKYIPHSDQGEMAREYLKTHTT